MDTKSNSVIFMTACIEPEKLTNYVLVSGQMEKGNCWVFFTCRSHFGFADRPDIENFLIIVGLIADL